MNEQPTLPISEPHGPAGRASYVLQRASALFERALARSLEPHNLTTGQFAVLEVLAQADTLGCSEVGKRLAGPSPDVTRLLDRLESVGLVSRERDKEDRRVVYTKITDAGRALLNSAAPDVRASEQRAFLSLSDSEQRELARLLSAVQGNLAER
ncbi:MAG: MarR family transcriptional regulator [Gemmatimonadaceae bacterium]|nr:MarR family transcriptional regulator [Gemmatimonadaceae bacterium]